MRFVDRLREWSCCHCVTDVGGGLAPTFAPEQPHGSSSQIVYVPTAQIVVDRMLEMARVTREDLVFDLGCGDGRIVVTAVSKYKARRGVGVDIDPERIKDSKATAKAAKVEGHKVAGTQGLGGSTVKQHWDLPDEKDKCRKALITNVSSNTGVPPAIKRRA